MHLFLKLVNRLRYYRLSIGTFFCTMLIYFKAKYLLGVKIKKHCKFTGKTIIHKTPNSTISINENCRFISKSNGYNLIGINRPCIIATHKEGAVIEIGEKSGFSGTVIGAFINIQIGKHVKCGANTLITDSDWHLNDYRSGEPKPVIIEDNVWLGEGVKVLKGVTIGKNSVIGAGSVVTKNIPADVIAAGNPCKVIKNINTP